MRIETLSFDGSSPPSEGHAPVRSCGEERSNSGRVNGKFCINSSFRCGAAGCRERRAKTSLLFKNAGRPSRVTALRFKGHVGNAHQRDPAFPVNAPSGNERASERYQRRCCNALKRGLSLRLKSPSRRASPPPALRQMTPLRPFAAFISSSCCRFHRGSSRTRFFSSAAKRRAREITAADVLR